MEWTHTLDLMTLSSVLENTNVDTRVNRKLLISISEKFRPMHA